MSASVPASRASTLGKVYSSSTLSVGGSVCMAALLEWVVQNSVTGATERRTAPDADGHQFIV
jgi:hypothetical protein